MASIHKGRTKRGGYEIRWRDLRGRNRRHWCPYKADANETRDDIVRFKSKGIDWSPAPQIAPRTIEDGVNAYLVAMKRRWTSPNTIRTAKTDFGQWIDLAGSVPLEEWSRSLVERFYDEQLKRCETSTSVTRTRKVEACWRWLGEHEDWSDETPRARSIDLPVVVTSTVSKTAPSWETMDKVVEAARGHSWYGRLFSILRYTGLRVSQAMHLEWRDVDLEDALLTIRGELGKSKQEKQGRVVPMSPYLVAALAGWGRRDGYLIDVTSRDHGGKINTTRRADGGTMSDIWIEAVGFAPRQPSHGFRRGIISGLRALGADLDLVKALVGHDRGVTGAVYSDMDMLRPRMQDVVALIPAIGASGVQEVSSLDAKRAKPSK